LTQLANCLAFDPISSTRKFEHGGLKNIRLSFDRLLLPKAAAGTVQSDAERIRADSK
jgi:hypothetical protein